MAFQSITTTEIQNGSTIDVSLLTKIKNNDDALNAKDSLLDTKDASQDTTISSLSANVAALVVVPVGAVLPFAGTVAPTNFLFTNGQAVSRTLYPALFAALGTTWGAGDGSTTFNLPDTRGTFLRGAGTSTGYAQNHTATLGTKESDQTQGHKHYINHGTDGGAGNVWMAGTGGSGRSGTVDRGVLTPCSDGTNGTPRTGDETRPMNIGINYIIRAI